MNGISADRKYLSHSTLINIALIAWAVLIIFDQATKAAAVRALEGGRHIELIPGVLELYYIQNKGAAFGIFQNATTVFSVVAVIALIAIALIYLRIPNGKKYIPFRITMVMIAAGAAGNLIDRMHLSYVRDFIYFSIINFPIFNVADMYVTIAVIFLIVLILFVYKEGDFSFLSDGKDIFNGKNILDETRGGEDTDRRDHHGTK